MGVNRKTSTKFFLALASFILVGSVMLDTLLTISIEKAKRVQAQYNLDQIELCIHSSVKGETPVDWAIRRCTKNSRTTTTGDVYVIDFNTLEFFYDPSTDVPRNGKLYFTEESIGESFADWDSAVEALGYILSGKNSNDTVMASYNYDGENEWLEWRYYHPNGNLDYNNSFVIVQGTQSDEALHEFKVLRVSGALLVLLVSGCLVIASVRSIK